MKRILFSAVMAIVFLFTGIYQPTFSQDKKVKTKTTIKKDDVKKDVTIKEKKMDTPKKEIKKEVTKKEVSKKDMKIDEPKKEMKKVETKKETSIDNSKKEKTDDLAGKTKDGKSVYAGPKGGFYTMSSTGSKSYIKENEIADAKTFGKTSDGKTIYEGPRGGRYYYNSNNEKTYVKK